MKMKRTLCLVLALVMLVGMFTVGASAATVSYSFCPCTRENPNLIDSQSKTYPVSEATCTADAVYHKVHTHCGRPIENETWTDVGSALPHDKVKVVNDAFLKTPANRVNAAEYYFYCTSCQNTIDETFFDGTPYTPVTVKLYSSESATTAAATATVDVGGTVDLPSYAAQMSNTGYIFDGWAINNGGTFQKVYSKGTVPTYDSVVSMDADTDNTLHFYALWIEDPDYVAPVEEYALNMSVAVDGTVLTGNHGFTLTKSGDNSYADGEKVTVSVTAPIAPKGYFYKFQGWVNGTGSKCAFTNAMANPAEITLAKEDSAASYSVIAQFKLLKIDSCYFGHKHAVTYTDGVAGAILFSDVTYYQFSGEYTKVPANPVRPGYKFMGWSPAVSTKVSGCVTYVAQWAPANTPALTSKHVAYLKGYGKGLVKPEGNITRAEAVTMLYRLMDDATIKEFYTTYNAFSDVAKGAWYYDAVSTMANAGILRSTTGKFAPDEIITRAEFFYMLTKFSNVTYNGKVYFVDVPANYWAYEELALAQYLGWIKGYGAGVLNPDATITRAEVAATLNRVLGRTNCKTVDIKKFTDNPTTAWYYQDIVEASIGH